MGTPSRIGSWSSMRCRKRQARPAVLLPSPSQHHHRHAYRHESTIFARQRERHRRSLSANSPRDAVRSKRSRNPSIPLPRGEADLPSRTKYPTSTSPRSPDSENRLMPVHARTEIPPTRAARRDAAPGSRSGTPIAPELRPLPPDQSSKQPAGGRLRTSTAHAAGSPRCPTRSDIRAPHARRHTC